MGKSLRLEPDVMHECVRLCNVLIEDLQKALTNARVLDHYPSFGDLQSIQELQAGYMKKATSGEASAVERIKQFIDAATQMRDNFAAGGQAFTQTDEETAQQFRKIADEVAR